MDDHVEVEGLAQDLLAQIARGVRLVDGVPQPPGGVHGLTADVDVRPLRPDGVRRDDRTLDQRVRVVGHQREVFARTRLTLVRVDHKVVRLVVVLGNEAPLHAGGEARTATAAQTRVLDELDQLVRVDRQRLTQRAVAVESLVRLALPGVG